MNNSYNSESKISWATFPEQQIGLLEKVLERIVKEDWIKLIK